jgi:hypothetical protein
MKRQSKLIPVAAFFLASTAFVRADQVIMHEMGGQAANTLTTLGTDFTICCGILAAGVVAAVFVSKKK